MKLTLTILFLILWQSCFGQADCHKASLAAKRDFDDSTFVFHSLEFQPVENTYLFVLREYYGIQWRFIDSGYLDFYDCYDSTLNVFLGKKYGDGYLKKAKLMADSLESTPNWIKDPEYPGGIKEVANFINSRLEISNRNTKDIKTKIVLQIMVNEKGQVENPRILKGISDQVDSQVVEIVKQMKDWEPAYLYGKPTRMAVAIPLIIENKK